MAHTPTPWRLYRAGPIDGMPPEMVEGADGVIVANIRWHGDMQRRTHDANADFIVRACNCHDDLVAALKKARQSLAVAISANTPPDFDVAEHVVIQQIDAALAKAEQPT